jgi:hypothetical protein
LKTCQKILAFIKTFFFFEKEFDGIMPLKLRLIPKEKKGVMKLYLEKDG